MLPEDVDKCPQRWRLGLYRCALGASSPRQTLTYNFRGLVPMALMLPWWRRTEYNIDPASVFCALLLCQFFGYIGRAVGDASLIKGVYGLANDIVEICQLAHLLSSRLLKHSGMRLRLSW